MQMKLMARKVRALLDLESKLSNADKGRQQWQLLCTAGGLLYIAGKGGVNTCFLTIAEGERRVMYPEQLVGELTKLASQSHSAYAVHSAKLGRIVSGPWPYRSDAPEHPSKAHHTLVGINDDGTTDEICYASRCLTGLEWIRVRKAGRNVN